MGKYLSGELSIQSGLVQHTLLQFIFNFALEYVIRKVQKTGDIEMLTETQQFQVDVDDDSLLGKKINAIKKNVVPLLDTSDDVDLEVNT
jgi:hypothetical protein